MATNNDNNGQPIIDNNNRLRDRTSKGNESFDSNINSSIKKLSASLDTLQDSISSINEDITKSAKELNDEIKNTSKYSKRLSDKKLAEIKADEKQETYNKEKEQLEKNHNNILKQLNRIKENEIDELENNFKQEAQQFKKQLEEKRDRHLKSLKEQGKSDEEIRKSRQKLDSDINKSYNLFLKEENDLLDKRLNGINKAYDVALENEETAHTLKINHLNEEHEKSDEIKRQEAYYQKRNAERQEELIKRQDAYFEAKQKLTSDGIKDIISKNNTESSDIFKSLQKTMQDITQANNDTISNKATGGNLSTILGKTLLSAVTKGLTIWTDTKLNTYVSNITDGIRDLQNSYSTTGMEISKALYLDRDEIKQMYGSFADDLVADGFDKATSEIEVAEQANTLASMGITDESMLRGMSVAMTEANLMTGGQLTFTTEDQVKDYYNQYQQLLEENGNDVTATNEAFKKVMMDQASYWVNTTKEYGNGIGLANGKFTEMANQAGELAERIHASNPDIDTEDIRKQIMSAYTATAGALGDIAPNLIAQSQDVISNLSTGEISSDTMALLSNTTHYEDIEKALADKDFGNAYISMIQGAMELQSKGEGTTYLYKSLGMDGTEIAKIANKFSDENGNFDVQALGTAISAGYNRNLEGSDSQNFANALEGIKTDTGFTVEQSKQNEALNDEAMDIWGEIPTDLADGDKMVIAGIESASNLIKDTINSGIELVVSSIMSGNAFSALTGGIGGGGAMASGLSAGFKGGASFLSGVTGSGFLAGATTLLGAAGIGASIGYAIGTPIAAAIDSAAEKIDVIGEQAGFEKMTEVVSKHIDDTKEAINKVDESIKQALNEDTQELFDNEDFQNTFSEQMATSSMDNFKETLNDINKGENTILDKNGKKVDLSKMSKNEAWQVVKKAKKEQDGYSFKGGDGGNETSNAIFSDYQASFKAYDRTLNESIDSIAANAALTGSDLDDAWNYYKSAREENGDSVSKKDKEKFEKSYDSAIQSKETYEDFVERSKDDLYGVYEDALYYQKNGDEENESLSWTDAWNKAWEDATEGDNAYIGDSDILDHHTENESPKEGEDFDIVGETFVLKYGVDFTPTGANDYMKYDPSHWGKYEIGLNNVPYDNFPALLHKGERVLTSTDADLLDVSNDIGNGIVSNKFRTLINNSVENNTTNSNLDNCVDAINTQTVSVDKQLENIIKLLQVAVTSLASLNNDNSYNTSFNLSSIAQKTGSIVMSQGVSAIS